MDYVADFETTTDPADCRVWGWGFVGIGSDWQELGLGDVEIGTDLDAFIYRVSHLNSTTYFHNLRFDGRFIIDWLLKHGYTHMAGMGNIPEGRFTSLISDMGQFYSITVQWLNGYRTQFRDSLKKLPMSVKRIAESFNMEQSKGEIDYEADRPVGYVITETEKDYIQRDVWIVARAVGQQLKNGLDKLTVGSDALAEYRKLIGNNEFKHLFPVLAFGMDAEIRRAYRGGFTYADPRFTGRINGRGLVLDVNSLYPSVMYYRTLPYGEPEYVTGRVLPTQKRPLTLNSITFTARIKPGHIPCIQIKGSSRFSDVEYLELIDEPTTLMVTNIDMALMEDHYNMDILEYHGGWRFRAANGLFDTYIDKWMQIKSHSTGGIREIAKLQLNSLYGKFATNPIVASKYPILDDTGTVQLKRGQDETRNPVYTAAGVFITSYARDITIRAAQANYDAFAYADTDSLHLLSDTVSSDIRIHPTDLGAWKHEYDFDAAYYIRAKAYLERKNDGTYHNAVAGIPTYMSAALTFDDLTLGRVLSVDHGTITRSQGDSTRSPVLHGKLIPHAYPGGIVLQDTPFELKL